MSRKNKAISHLEPLNITGMTPNADEVFGSADEMATSIDALIAFLNHRYSKKTSNAPGVLGFVIEQMDVRFVPDLADIEVETIFAQNRVSILAPLISRESPKKKEERRIEILKQFLPTMKEAQFRATVQLYKTLTADGRKTLIEEFKIPFGKTPKRKRKAK